MKQHDHNGGHDSPRPSRSVIQRIAIVVRAFIRAGVLLLALFLIAGQLGEVHPLLDLFSHFQMLYLVFGVIGAVLLLLCRSRRMAMLSLLVAIIACMFIAPWHLPPNQPDVSHGIPIRVMLFNILQSNTRYDDVVDEVRRHAPDVIVFQEVHEPWHNGLRPLSDDFPHEFYHPAGIVRGNLIMSRFPLIDAKPEAGAQFSSPGAIATLDVNGQLVSLLVAHTWPPTGTLMSEVRNAELVRVAARATELPAPLILLGDLNITMWSPHYRRFERDSRLVNARRGFGVIATFPMDDYAILRVPIDHCLVSPDIAVLDCRRGEPCGSDHAPLIVDLVLPRFSP